MKVLKSTSIFAAVFLISNAAGATEILASKYACTACHQQDHKLIGPSFEEVRNRYKDNPDAVNEVARNIERGGAGKWGVIPMPPQAGIPKNEILALAAWVLQAKSATGDTENKISTTRTTTNDARRDAIKCRNQGYDTGTPGFAICMQSFGHLGSAPAVVGAAQEDATIKPKSVEASVNLEKAKEKCKEFGIKEGTEKFGKCVLTISR